MDNYFLEVINQLIVFDLTPGKPFEIYGFWLKKIQVHCLNYFDQKALSEASNSNDIKRIIEAKNHLLGALYPNKKGLIKDIVDYVKQKEKANEI